jgi:hypothetical protein
LEKGATAGPWYYRCGAVQSETDTLLMSTSAARGNETQDGKLIAELRNHARALIDVAKYAKNLLSECCENSRDLHWMLELEEALERLK